jgi:hypothetical protein
MHNERFYLPLSAIKANENGELSQYCSLYFNRLKELKPLVKEAAEMKWAKLRPHFMDNILDMQPNRRNVIIGTLFKEQKLKPNVFTNISGAINAVSAFYCSMGEPSLMGKFASDSDTAILEDASGRISIRSTDQFDCNHFVTGSIIALLGHVDQGGYFVCEDHCFAGIPFKDNLPQ